MRLRRLAPYFTCHWALLEDRYEIFDQEILKYTFSRGCKNTQNRLVLDSFGRFGYSALNEIHKKHLVDPSDPNLLAKSNQGHGYTSLLAGR
jgi:hypothetical protein